MFPSPCLPIAAASPLSSPSRGTINNQVMNNTFVKSHQLKAGEGDAGRLKTSAGGHGVCHKGKGGCGESMGGSPPIVEPTHGGPWVRAPVRGSGVKRGADHPASDCAGFARRGVFVRVIRRGSVTMPSMRLMHSHARTAARPHPAPALLALPCIIYYAEECPVVYRGECVQTCQTQQSRHTPARSTHLYFSGVLLLGR